ncbi:MAG TPA: response regulator transcription factor [Longimicrobiaceae bacterium]|jgi:two-component system copper resistance phosphate regulon response regulator CusR|nr:response regulator transcription factor [Longimicrobiaceae bacterium]
MRILVVEDDPQLQKLISDGFREKRLDVVCASTFAEGREKAFMGSYGVIVLDIMLPGGSGMDLCARLRKQGITTPILMLTARDTLDDKVAGLAAGADDYLVKPFAFRELLARVEALARRPAGMMPAVSTFADLEVDLRTRKVRRAGREITLTAKEFELLEFFVRHAGSVVDRAAITGYVWDDNHDPFTNALEVLVRRLRRKIDDDFEPKLIQTLRGAGYRFGV